MVEVGLRIPSSRFVDAQFLAYFVERAATCITVPHLLPRPVNCSVPFFPNMKNEKKNAMENDLLSADAAFDGCHLEERVLQHQQAPAVAKDHHVHFGTLSVEESGILVGQDHPREGQTGIATRAGHQGAAVPGKLFSSPLNKALCDGVSGKTFTHRCIFNRKRERVSVHFCGEECPIPKSVERRTRLPLKSCASYALIESARSGECERFVRDVEVDQRREIEAKNDKFCDMFGQANSPIIIREELDTEAGILSSAVRVRKFTTAD